ncbi:PqqD family protein [Bacillus glycinifermentans]|uniref:Metallopeptidase n=1 Tax=Bacillus glycinifermentans TaxID=1664069 RepID=A0A0T6BLW3_9BACI|nr:PqqD family protein [Bacillus glycinifermentans]ATH94815.1 pyrroloquinoline quinone biosynthesis protein PqqD [Bacillus glycinifermentans]KRT92167.1 metallopeptidase [Bacillus glycinifermentans]MEC0486849.1 PqqD family protein [Bacillus glycinifermentans]MEC0493961.1 PqqD family protein [Bacillus glycinifermentans]MEC0543216.1 PqqD family protein [Bacillus glycinifermentans]
MIINMLKTYFAVKKIPYFPEHVTLNEKYISDHDLGADFPINPTAYRMLQEIDGKKDEAEIAAGLADVFRISESVLQKDLHELLTGLNRRYLINWKYGGFLQQFLSQYRPGYRERFSGRSDSFLFLYITCLHIISRKIILFWFIFLVLSIAAYIAVPDRSIVNIAVYFSIIYAGLISGTVLHETVHGTVHRRFVGKQGPDGFLAADMMSVKFVRPAVSPYRKKMIWITVLGPLVPGILGVAGVLFTILCLRENMVSAGILLFFATYALHMLYLLPFMGDGKSIMKQLMIRGIGGKSS